VGEEGGGAVIEAWTADDPWPGGTDRLLLVGPPGTGKTRTILDAYVLDMLDERAEVLVTSFTRAAASELRRRVGAATATNEERWLSTLSTIHSEAWRRCSDAGFLSTDKQAAVRVEAHDEEEDNYLLRVREEDDRSATSAWDGVRQRWPEDIGKPIRDRLSRLLHGPRLEDAVAMVRADRDGRYEDGRLLRPDFTDVLEYALVSGSPRSLDLLAIDEAQDLTPLQWALVDRWASDARRLLLVGDPDQSIYGWSGADGRRLLRWLRDDLPARRLARSWRVPRRPHALARRVILEVSDRVDAPYLPAERDGEVAESADVDLVMAEVLDEAQAGRTVFILSRSNAGCSQAVGDLTAADIPHIAERGRRVLGATSESPSSMLRVVRAMQALCAPTGAPEARDARILVEGLRSGSEAVIGRGKGQLVTWLRSQTRRVDRRHLIDGGIAVDRLVAAWEDPDERWWQRVTLESRIDVGALLTVRDWTIIYGGEVAMFAIAARVRVITCHGAKGREADMVVLDVRKCSGAWGRSGDDAARDEDRRVMYVGITRTQDRLLVLRGDERDWMSQVLGYAPIG
jgi:superfamily I DNA/RNA helicase